jgi:fido (protein-threonine AMPylation protein)
MTSEGYEAFDDPYLYKGTNTLKNRLGLRDPALLESFELEMTTSRAREPLPAGRYDPLHYRQVHRHLFQDVYRWAGKYRSVRIAKGRNLFCYPEQIEASMNRLFDSFHRNDCLGAKTAGRLRAATRSAIADGSWNRSVMGWRQASFRRVRRGSNAWRGRWAASRPSASAISSPPIRTAC